VPAALPARPCSARPPTAARRQGPRTLMGARARRQGPRTLISARARRQGPRALMGARARRRAGRQDGALLVLEWRVLKAARAAHGHRAGQGGQGHVFGRGLCPPTSGTCLAGGSALPRPSGQLPLSWARTGCGWPADGSAAGQGHLARWLLHAGCSTLHISSTSQCTHCACCAGQCQGVLAMAVPRDPCKPRVSCTCIDGPVAEILGGGQRTALPRLAPLAAFSPQQHSVHAGPTPANITWARAPNLVSWVLLGG